MTSLIGVSPCDLGITNADFGLSFKEATNPKSEISNPKSVTHPLPQVVLTGLGGRDQNNRKDEDDWQLAPLAWLGFAGYTPCAICKNQK
jgi:hypothetical protein